MPAEHPNYTKQKAEARARMLGAAHLEALAYNIRFDVMAVLKRNPGWELDVDNWGCGGIVIRHFPNTTNQTFLYDVEIPLETT